MSNRFHNKWHRASHHTYKDPTIIDAGWDPIASPDSPFQGDFVLADGSGGTQIGELYSKIIHTTKLTPESPEGQDWNADKILVDTNLEVTKNITGDVDLYVKRNTSGHGWLKIDSYGDFGGYLHSVGNISGDSQLFITGDGTFGGNVNITGNETVKGNFNLTGNANINGSISGHSWLKIDQYGHFVGDVSGDSNLYVTGYGHIGEYVHIYGNDGTADAYGLIVDNNSHFVGSADIDSNLNVDGYTYINGQDTDGWGLKVDKKLNVNGKTVLNDQLDVLGANNNNISGNIRLKGNLSADDYIRTTNNLDVSGDGHIVQNLQVDGYVHINGDPSDAAGHALVVPDLYVTQHLSAVSATFHNIDITASEGRGFVVTGYAPGETVPVDYFEVPTTPFIHGDKNVYLDKVGLFVDGWTVLSGDALLYRKLNVSGDSTFVNTYTTGTSTVSTLNVTGDLSVTGDSTFVDTYTTGTATIKTLSVTGDSDLDGNLDVGGTLSVTGATTLNSTLNVSGDTTLTNTSVSGTLGVTGATTLGNTLGVTGATTLNSALNVYGDTKVKNLSAENTYVNGTFEATGATTLDSKLNVSGNTNTKGLTADGDVKANTLTVTGNTSVAGLTASSDVSVKTLSVTGGDTKVKNLSAENTYVNGTFEVTGDSTFVDTYTTGTATTNILSVTGSATVGSRGTGPVGDYSFAVGSGVVAKGKGSFADGYRTSAYGDWSMAQGDSSYSGGNDSHAEGTVTSAYAGGSHAEGGWTIASGGTQTHAEGLYTSAFGKGSHAEGWHTKTDSIYSHAEGTYNASHILTENDEEVPSGTSLHTVGFGSANNDRKNAVETMKDGKTFIYGIGGYDGTNPTGAGVEDLSSVIKDMKEVTYDELVDLRDNDKLVPGRQYRITDYTCTTTQTDTSSAGHLFDVIVIADSINKINEKARAINHVGDSHFDSCNLAKWQIWYCLDNDVSRFAWADNINGKGVIYRMIDDYDNDLPYDFKNIKFLVSGYDRYTFDQSGIDATIIRDNCQSNKMKPRTKYVDNVMKQVLNFNTFGPYCSWNVFGRDSENNTFGANCFSNVFGAICQNNTFGDNCFMNVCNNDFLYNVLGTNCVANIFGNYCYYNTFGHDCRCCSFGNECSYIVFGSSGSIKNYYQYIIVENGNGHIYLDCTGTPAGNNWYSNVTIAQGVNNTSTWKTITDPKSPGQTFKTTFQPANSQVISV